MKEKIQAKIRSGMKPKEAIARTLAEEYMDKMNGDKNVPGDMGVGGDAIYPKGTDEYGLSENVEDAGKLAAALTSYDANDMDYKPEMSSQTGDGRVLNKASEMQEGSNATPDPEQGGGAEDIIRAPKPFDSGVSVDAMEAIKRKRMGRKYIQ